MRVKRWTAVGLVVLVCLAGLSACSASTPAGEPEGPATTAPDGKADNYRSPYGGEFDVVGDVPIDLGDAQDSSFDAATAEAQGIVERTATALEAVLQREWTEERRKNERNLTVMMRTGSTGIGEVRGGEGGLWEVRFYAELGGPNDFLDRFPVRREGDRSFIDVTIEVLDVERQIALEVTPSEQTEDAYPKYFELFEDGLDVTFHVGGDYNDPRDDVAHARRIYDDLIEQGFASPVDGFDELALDSGPLTSQLQTHEGLIDLRVTIHHPEMVPDDRLEELVDAYKASAASADVIIYSGHAGTDTSYSGVVVHYDPRVALPADDFATIDLPTKYQIFVFNGCETYTGYADQLYRNPNKNPSNLDVVTTVNYSWTGTQDEEFLRGLWKTYNRGFFPQSWDGLLRALEENQGNSDATTIYGVHGIDDNPKITPTADLESLGFACQTDQECPGVDNLCVTMSTGDQMCGVACTSTAGCPEGYTCRALENAPVGQISHCLPPG